MTTVREMRLQRCRTCSAFQYPARDVCRACLSDGLTWEDVGHGIVTSITRLHTTNEPAFQQLLPFWIASIRVEDVQVVAFAAEGAADIGTEVALVTLENDGGRLVVCAVPKGAQIPPDAQIADILKMR